MRGVTRALRAAVVVLVGLPMLLVGLAPAARAAVPRGFQITTLPTGQAQYDLTNFAFTPDGGWFATGKGGLVTWTSPQQQSREIGRMSATTDQDRGLTGLAVAPGWPQDPTIYTTRSMPGSGHGTLRLSSWQVRFDAAGQPVSLTGERNLLELPNRSDVHLMTDVLADRDGSLWVAIGDDADFRVMDPLALAALDPNQGYGKLLHLMPTGEGLDSNPFYDPADPRSWRSRVYAMGFRSPFRFSLDPITGGPVLGDVGWGTWEEVNLVRPGASYGWPCFEGLEPTAAYRDLPQCRGQLNTAPLTHYVHGEKGTSVTGGFVYSGEAYPQQYRGSYFYGDYSSGRLYTLRHDANGTLLTPPQEDGFISGEGAPVAIRPAPNGDVVWADILTGTLKRLSWVEGNRAPLSDVRVSTDPATLTVTLDATGSTDPDGDVLTHRFDLGDGTRATTATVTHRYAGRGPYTVRHTVTDPFGASTTRTIEVRPGNHSPQLRLTTPAEGTTFAVGDRVRLTATATDADGGTPSITWSTTLLHCSGGYCHRHPGASVNGPTYDQEFVDHGDDTTLLLTATATDSMGATTSKTWEARPRLRTISVAGTAAAPISINGHVGTSHAVTVGSKVSVTAPEQAGDGVATFERWTDGAPRTRTLTMPDRDITLEAVYLTPIDRRFNAEPALQDLLGPTVGGESGSATSRTRVHQRGQLHWTPGTGVHELHGSILEAYRAQGGEPALGVPASDELTTWDGRGRFNDLTGTPQTGPVAIYWSPATPASVVYGSIREKWGQHGWEAGVLGYPRTSEYATPNGQARYNHFQGGSIYWSPATGAHEVHGSIHQRWAGLGWETSPLRLPTTDELVTPDGRGRYNHFEAGSLYWSPATGAHEVYGSIRATWASLGWETSWLGYPTSGEFAIPGGRRSNFQGGWLEFRARDGRVIVHRW